MNHLVSQIANLDRAGATVSTSLVRKAVAESIAESWADGAALLGAIASGTLNIPVELARVNDELVEAGATTRADQDDIRGGLSEWAEENAAN